MIICWKHLANKVTLTRNGDAFKKCSNEINSVLRDMFNRKEINHKVRDYLLMRKPQLSRLHLLPKFHKRASNALGRSNNNSNNTTYFRGDQGLPATFIPNWSYTWKYFITWCGWSISGCIPWSRCPTCVEFP